MPTYHTPHTTTHLITTPHIIIFFDNIWFIGCAVLVVLFVKQKNQQVNTPDFEIEMDGGIFYYSNY